MLHSEQRILLIIRIAWAVNYVAPKTVGGFCFVFIQSSDWLACFHSVISSYLNCKVRLDFLNAIEP